MHVIWPLSYQVYHLVSTLCMLLWHAEERVQLLHFHPSTSHHLPNIWWRPCFWPGVSYIKLTGRECLTSLVNVARFCCVMKRDNSNARKSTFFTRHIYCKKVVLSDDAPNQHQECCISMWREAACLNDCALSWADHMDIERFNNISPGLSFFRDFGGAQK